MYNKYTLFPIYEKYVDAFPSRAHTCLLCDEVLLSESFLSYLTYRLLICLRG